MTTEGKLKLIVFIKIAMIVSILPAVAGIIFFIHLGINGYRSSSWPQVQGVLEDREVSFSASKRTSSHVRYRYEVAGRGYSAKQESFGVSFRQPRYIINGPITVYYDPQDPANAVLVPGYSWINYVVIAMLVLWAFPITPIVFSELKKYKEFLLEEEDVA